MSTKKELLKICHDLGIKCKKITRKEKLIRRIEKKKAELLGQKIPYVIKDIKENLDIFSSSATIDTVVESMENIEDDIKNISQKTTIKTPEELYEILILAERAKAISESGEKSMYQRIKDASIKLFKTISYFSGSLAHFDLIERTLAYYNVDIEDLKKFNDKYVEKIKKMYAEGKTVEEATKLLVQDVKDIIIQKASEKKYMFPRKIVLGITLTIIAFMMNSYIIKLMIEHQSLMGYYASLVIIAPIIEETIKMMFVGAEIEYTGTTVTFGIEFIYYVFLLINAGGNVPVAVFIRAAVLMMHYSTMFQQKFFQKRDSVFFGWLVGLITHSIWNLLGVVYNETFSNMLFGFNMNSTASIDTYFKVYNENKLKYVSIL
jgi:hypothetical protein